MGGERRESHRASCAPTPTPSHSDTLVALPPPASARRPYLQVAYMKLGVQGRGWMMGEREGRVRAGKKGHVKGGVLRRRDPVIVCSPWPGTRMAGPWLPRSPFSGFLVPPSVQHGGTSFADRKYDCG